MAGLPLLETLMGRMTCTNEECGHRYLAPSEYADLDIICPRCGAEMIWTELKKGCANC